MLGLGNSLSNSAGFFLTFYFLIEFNGLKMLCCIKQQIFLPNLFSVPLNILGVFFFYHTENMFDYSEWGGALSIQIS